MRAIKKVLFPALFVFAIPALFMTCGGTEEKTDDTKTEKKQNEIVEDVIDEIVAPSDFCGLLIELESNMGWESVTNEWKTRREGWVSECSAESNLMTKSDRLLEFESNVVWSAVQTTWANVRADWVNDVRNATTESELAGFLIVFESYVLWDVVSPNWVNLREDWIVRCNSIGA